MPPPTRSNTLIEPNPSRVAGAHPGRGRRVNLRRRSCLRCFGRHERGNTGYLHEVYTCVGFTGRGGQIAWLPVARGRPVFVCLGALSTEARSRRPPGAKHHPTEASRRRVSTKCQNQRVPLGTDDADDLRLYLEAAAREPLLTKEEEVELAMTIEAGKEAEDRLRAGRLRSEKSDREGSPRRPRRRGGPSAIHHGQPPAGGVRGPQVPGPGAAAAST